MTFTSIEVLSLCSIVANICIISKNFASEITNIDEFVNLGKFTNYEEFLATCRGYGIGVATIIQTLTQLQDRYNKEKAESILGNCAVQICMGAGNNTTAEYFSKLLGKATVRVETENSSSSKNTDQKGNSSSHSENESYSARDLMTAGEIKSMETDTQLIVFSKKPPLKTQKAYQYEIFPNPDVLLNQNDYENHEDPKQTEKFNQLVNEFESKAEENEEKKQERLEIIQQEKKEKEEKEQKEKDDNALNHYLEDDVEEDV